MTTKYIENKVILVGPTREQVAAIKLSWATRLPITRPAQGRSTCKQESKVEVTS
ncbi:hypothetical protein ACS0TY_004077 [Phlomoides rotata]